MLPMVLLLIGMVLTLTFYLYAVCFLHQTAYIAALRGSLSLHEDARETAETELERLLAGKLLNICEVKREVRVSALSVEVILEAETALPVTEILPLSESRWKIEVRKEAKIRSAPAYIRMLRQIGR